MAKAMAGPEQVAQLQTAVLETVAELLGEVHRAAGVLPEETYEAVVVGNATMLSLLCGVNPESLALAP
jgi:uncharacterized 2Fe-2S/4Fe-4S cluster protein (DUF4445 family)